MIRPQKHKYLIFTRLLCMSLPIFPYIRITKHFELFYTRYAKMIISHTYRGRMVSGTCIDTDCMVVTAIRYNPSLYRIL